MLASDYNNPDFQGARNPDTGLFVEFYWEEPIDAWASREASMKEQRNVKVKLPKQAFVRIMVPGDKTTEVTQAVSEAHKHRFPQQWMAWQIAEGIIGSDGDIPGWKLSEWPDLNEDQVRELTYLRFQTVEQLAGATDRQLQGMGMGGTALKEKARIALRNRMGEETKAALEAKDKEMADMKASLEAMQTQVAQLLASNSGKQKLGLPSKDGAQP